jgi:Phytanoyl-CoA dioxygenase (PhyH)
MSNAAAELATNGVAIVRGYMSPDEAANLRKTVDDIYACLISNPHLANGLFGKNFRAWHGVWLKQLPIILRQTHPDLEFRYYQSLRLIEGQVSRLFGRNWRFFAKRSYFRRHVGVSKQVPWHIDADAASIYAFAGSAMNVWLTLDPVGTDRPSLDIVPRSHAVMRRLPLLTGKDLYREDGFVSAIGEPSTPQLRPGDALIFDQFLLHRTQRAGSDGVVRTSCEFRFIRASMPTLHGLHGWLRYNCNALFSADGLLAAKAKILNRTN